MFHIFIACVSVVNYHFAYFGVSAANDSAAAAPGGSGSSSSSMGSRYVSGYSGPGYLCSAIGKDVDICNLQSTKINCVCVWVCGIEGKERKEKQDSERESAKNSTAAEKINTTRLVSLKNNESTSSKVLGVQFYKLRYNKRLQ